MTKAELIDRIARNRDLPPDITKKIIAQILDISFAELAAYFIRSRVTKSANPRFAFPKFGTFIKKKRSSRRGVNPRTLEPMEIEACDTLDFKPSAELKRQLNEVGRGKGKTRKKVAKKTRASGKQAAQKTRSRSAKPSAERGAKVPASVGRDSRATGRPAGPSGRKLVTREEAELELPASTLLPDAPLQRVTSGGRRGGGDVGNTGS